jgi:hypothetical protein
VDEKGKVDRVSSDVRQFIGKPLSEIVGKEMLKRLWPQS